MGRDSWLDERSGADVEGEYRYRLWRSWAPARGRCVFVMLNPSTADASQDDATIRRCVDFVTRWDFGCLDVVNLYALRSTDPKSLRSHADPIGPRGDIAIEDAVQGARRVVAAWGTNATAARHRSVLAALRRTVPDVLVHLGLTKAGFPRHPLYLPAATVPTPWGNPRG